MILWRTYDNLRKWSFVKTSRNVKNYYSLLISALIYELWVLGSGTVYVLYQVWILGPLDLTHEAQRSLQPRHSPSLSAVCPGKLSWDLGLESNLKDWSKPGCGYSLINVFNHWMPYFQRIPFSIFDSILK